jgi:hypothetical protein
MMKRSLFACALALALCAAPAWAQQKRRGRKPRVTETPRASLAALEPRYIPRASVAPGQIVWCADDPRPPGTGLGYTIVGKTDRQGCSEDPWVIELPREQEKEEWRRKSEETARQWQAIQAEDERQNELAIAARRVRLGMNQEQARRAWGRPTNVTRRQDEDGNDIEIWSYRGKGRLLFLNDYLDRIVEY